MNDEGFWMGIYTEKERRGFDFYIGDEITNEEGEKVRPLLLRTYEQ